MDPIQTDVARAAADARAAVNTEITGLRAKLDAFENKIFAHRAAILVGFPLVFFLGFFVGKHW